MIRSKHITMLFWACAASLAGSVYAAEHTGAEAVMLEIIDGETAFRVDVKHNKAWWIVGECQRPIPMDATSGKSQKNSNNSMMSNVISNDVRLGARQVDLRQQFRFNMASTPVTVDVYNSVRGGWSQVPVRENFACMNDAACRRLAELPEC